MPRRPTCPSAVPAQFGKSETLPETLLGGGVRKVYMILYGDLAKKKMDYSTEKYELDIQYIIYLINTLSIQDSNWGFP
jgi:hypothetical protein